MTTTPEAGRAVLSLLSPAARATLDRMPPAERRALIRRAVERAAHNRAVAALAVPVLADGVAAILRELADDLRDGWATDDQ